jgi:hypothetical protein
MSRHSETKFSLEIVDCASQSNLDMLCSLLWLALARLCYVAQNAVLQKSGPSTI